MRGAVTSLASGQRRKFSVIPPLAIMLTKCDLDTENKVSTPEVVPNNDPQREILTQPHTIQMIIYSTQSHQVSKSAVSVPRFVQSAGTCWLCCHNGKLRLMTCSYEFRLCRQWVHTGHEFLKSWLLSSDAAPDAVQCRPPFWFDRCMWSYKHRDIGHHSSAHSPVSSHTKLSAT